jgi:hypothetical protein
VLEAAISVPRMYASMPANSSAGKDRAGRFRCRPMAGGGELLAATTGGRLQIRDRVTLQVAWEHDLAPMVPDSGEPPAEARRW